MNDQTTQQVIKMLLDTDGDSMQTILRGVCMENQMLKQLVGTASPLDLKNALEAREEFTRKDLIRRMKHVKQDADVVIAHLMDGKQLDEMTEYGAALHTHLDNITTACDLNDEESLHWTFQ
jgi:hypothetical protein